VTPCGGRDINQADIDNEPLEITEVQSGIYLGKDTIIRFEDVYGRFDNNSKC
jgi:hypothetical protein